MANVSNNRFGRLAGACAQSRKRERSTHQLQKFPAPARVLPLRRLPRKLAMQKFLKTVTLSQLVQTAPVLLAAALLQAPADCVEIACSGVLK